MRDEPSVQRVRQALHDAGAVGTIRTFDNTVPTAAAAAQALSCDVAAIANSLVFTADHQPLLVIASGARRVDLTRVANLVGAAKVRRATPEQVFAATGQRIGGVAPVGHMFPIPTVVDVCLAEHDVIWAGAGDDYSMFPTSEPELVKLTGGVSGEVGSR